MKDVLTPENIQKVADKFNFSNEEDMYAAVGYNGITALQVANRLTEKRKRRDQEEQEKIVQEVTAESKPYPQGRKREAGVRVKGIDNLLVRLSKSATLYRVTILSDLSQKAEGFGPS